jgi:hypothetical protein
MIGCSAVVLQASKRGAPAGSWLEQMTAPEPRMLVMVAQANKTARIIWALLIKQEEYKARSRLRRKPRRTRGRRSRSKEGMAQQSTRRGRTTRAFHCNQSTLWVIWIRSANSHTDRSVWCCIRGRPDGSIRPRVRSSKYRLRLRGRPRRTTSGWRADCRLTAKTIET